MKEVDKLKVTHPEIQKMRDHLEEITEWKNRVLMFLEDDLSNTEKEGY